MPIQSEFEKIQSKIMNRTIDDPRLARLTESIQNNKLVLDGNFLVENKKLKELLEECIDWIINNPPLLSEDLKNAEEEKDYYYDLIHRCELILR
jgi:hypothetical protein